MEWDAIEPGKAYVAQKASSRNCNGFVAILTL